MAVEGWGLAGVFCCFPSPAHAVVSRREAHRRAGGESEALGERRVDPVRVGPERLGPLDRDHLAVDPDDRRGRDLQVKVAKSEETKGGSRSK